MTKVEKIKTEVERIKDTALRGLQVSNGAVDYFNGRLLAAEEVLHIIDKISKEDGKEE